MAEPDTDAARLALAAIAETTGEEPLADRYREEMALRVATFTDLDVPAARRLVETTYQATTLGELLVRVNAISAGAEMASVFRQLKRAVQGLSHPDDDGRPA